MHIGGRCLDLRVMSCLCCKWLEWWRCNRAWPFKIACGQWLALCWVLCSSGLAAGPVMSQRSGWSPDVSCCSAKLHCQSASLHSSLIWSDSMHTTQQAGPRAAAALYIINGAEACQACLTLMLDVSYLFFCSPPPTQLADLLNDLTFAPYGEICSIFVSYLCENLHLVQVLM